MRALAEPFDQLAHFPLMLLLGIQKGIHGLSEKPFNIATITLGEIVLEPFLAPFESRSHRNASS